VRGINLAWIQSGQGAKKNRLDDCNAMIEGWDAREESCCLCEEEWYNRYDE